MEIAMKSPWKIIVVPFVALALLATVETTAYAQDTSANSVPITKKMMRKEDRALAANVRRHLNKAHVSTADITILARAGAVYLVGTVTDQAMITTAGDTAGQVDGVKSVKNNLTIRVAGH
jgi:hyperosmotically inducible protein